MSEPDEPGAQPAPRVPWWRGRVALVTAGMAVVLIVSVIVAVRPGIGPGGPGDLPSPRVLARDPVPAGRVFWTVPENCGVPRKTVDELTPHAEVNDDGVNSELTCSWSSDITSKRGLRSLTVSAVPVHAGPGVPNTVYGQGGTTFDAAITRFNGSLKSLEAGASPLRGLGDDAVLGGEHRTSADRSRRLVFRAGNTVVAVEYLAEPGTGGPGADKKRSSPVVRHAVLRAAADVARSFGVPAAPVPAPAPPAAEPAELPGRICTKVSTGLRDRLMDDDRDAADSAAKGSEGDTDPFRAAGDSGAAAHTTSCTWSTGARSLSASVTTAAAGDPATALREASREYLRRYYAKRDEPPVSAHDARYFHALAGAGDAGFCSYIQGASNPVDDAYGPAYCVIRTGAALVTTRYASRGDPGDDDAKPPLTLREAVNGAYAAALPVLRAVRR